MFPFVWVYYDLSSACVVPSLSPTPRSLPIRPAFSVSPCFTPRDPAGRSARALPTARAPAPSAKGMGATVSNAAEEEPAELKSPDLWKSRVSRYVPNDEELLCQPIPESFEFLLEDNLAAAREVLLDERVAQLRFRLVPSMLEEAQFWRALFYRLSLPDDEGVAVQSPPPEPPCVPPEPPHGRSESPPKTAIPMPPIDFDYF